MKSKGGALFVMHSNNLSVSDTVFEENKSYFGGGGLYIKNISTINL